MNQEPDTLDAVSLGETDDLPPRDPTDHLDATKSHALERPLGELAVIRVVQQPIEGVHGRRQTLPPCQVAHDLDGLLCRHRDNGLRQLPSLRGIYRRHTLNSRTVADRFEL